MKEGEEIIIKADDFYDYVRKDGGVVAFITTYEDNENIFNIDNIEENTKFNFDITAEETGNTYNLKCRL